MSALSVRCVPYSASSFEAEVKRATGAASTECDQVEYLKSYLSNRAVGAKSIVVERPYIDRHYLEEFAGYYATALRSAPPTTTRLHFFSTSLNSSGFRRRLERAADGQHDEVIRELSSAYLGFAVLRPIRACPVGRTILRPFPVGAPAPARRYVWQEHRVHLCGLELTVLGVPFQQQDQAVGACATVALWSALARVMRADGNRPPTPLAVTSAATRHVVHTRTFPALDGLTMDQMVAAIREFGYSAHVMSAAHAGPEFKMAVKCYLGSGIPVILVQDGHAAAAVGYREADPQRPSPDILLSAGGKSGLRTRGFSHLYVHDDRLGPYARMKWRDPPKDAEVPRLVFDPPETFQANILEGHLKHAIAPLYPKVWLSASDLILTAARLLPFIGGLVEAAGFGKEVLVDLEFKLGGSYVRELFMRQAAPKRVTRLAQKCHLSRYVGLIRFRTESQHIVDVICDTTDIHRPGAHSAVLAVLVHPDQITAACEKFVKDHLPAAQAF